MAVLSNVLRTLLACLSLNLSFASGAPSFPPSSADNTRLARDTGYFDSGLAVRSLHQFPNTIWIENIAVRQNGLLLVTEMTAPRLWEIDPFSNSTMEVASFPSRHKGLLGITETQPDIFAVVAGNFSLTEPIGSAPGSYSLYIVNMTANPPTVNLSKDMPQASFLNGISYLPKPYDSVLLADSSLGTIFQHNLTTNTTSRLFTSPLLARCSASALEGINGMKLSFSPTGEAEYLFFTNAYCNFLGRIPIYPNGTARPLIPELRGLQTPEDFTNNLTAWDEYIIARTSSPNYIFDDFILYPPNPANANWGGGAGANVTAYLATGVENVITQVLASGESSVLAGSLNSTEISEPTALAWGRGRGTGMIYATTGGGLGGQVWVEGTPHVVGGQVVEIRLDQCKGDHSHQISVDSNR